MIREIIFRGKSIDDGEWIAGIAFPHDSEGCSILYQNLLDGSLEGKEVYPETVGQSTGLFDKNGKKIFEGDIVTGFFDHEKVIGTIVYGSNAQYYIGRKGLYGIYLDNAEDWLEIVGNIWDNPELLEEETQ